MHPGGKPVNFLKMSLLYIFLLPFFVVVLYRRMAFVAASIRERDNSRLKAELLFLFLSLVVMAGMVAAIELI